MSGLDARTSDRDKRATVRESVPSRLTLLVPFGLMAVLAAVCVAQIWLTGSRRQIAIDLSTIERDIEDVEDEIVSWSLASERRYAPDQVAAIAQELGFVSIEEAPVVVAVSEERPEDELVVTKRPLFDEALAANQAAFLMGFLQTKKDANAPR